MRQEQYIELPRLNVSEYHLSAEPPRGIPRGVTFELLFGGILNQFGWLLLAFSAILLWRFATNADLGPFLFRSGYSTAPGSVLRIADTGWGSSGVPDNPSERVPGLDMTRRSQAYTYTYTDTAGQTHGGTSYGLLQEGIRNVTVEYLKRHPQISRIAGMQTGSLDSSGLVVCVFPMVGLVIVIGSFHSGLGSLRLLRRGAIAVGRGRSCDPSDERGECHGATFTFCGGDGVNHDVRTTDIQVAGRLANGDTVTILYDPEKPSQFKPLSFVRGDPEIESGGRILVRSHGWMVLVLPILAITGNLLSAYFCLLR